MKERREAMGADAKELARKAGTSPTSWSFWENDRRVPPEARFPSIADALGVTAAELAAHARHPADPPGSIAEQVWDLPQGVTNEVWGPETRVTVRAREHELLAALVP